MLFRALTRSQSISMRFPESVGRKLEKRNLSRAIIVRSKRLLSHLVRVRKPSRALTSRALLLDEAVIDALRISAVPPTQSR